MLKRISAKKKGRRENETDKKRPDLEERGGRCVLTVSHVYHFPDLPGGEITIEGTSTVKHCTTHSNNKEKPKDKNGLKKKEGRALLKRISAKKKGRRENETDKKRPDLEERGGRCVLT